MTSFDKTLHQALQLLVQEGKLSPDCDFSGISFDPPRDERHGDITTNAALILGQKLKRSPRDIAALLEGKLKNHPDVKPIPIYGTDIPIPGFIFLPSNNILKGYVKEFLDYYEIPGTCDIDYWVNFMVVQKDIPLD